MKILVLGKSGSGKTTAAEMVAKMIGSPEPKNCSDFIIIDYAKEKDDKNTDSLIQKIKSNKDEYRQELFKYGLSRQKQDPAYPVSEAVKHTDVVTGIRTVENLEASKKFFDVIMWIDRIAAPENSTDQLGPLVADKVIDNNGSMEDLKDNLKMALIDEMT